MCQYIQSLINSPPPEWHSGMTYTPVRTETQAQQTDIYCLFILQGTGNRTGNGKQWVSILCYVLYTLHSDRDREPLFLIVSIPVPVHKSGVFMYSS